MRHGLVLAAVSFLIGGCSQEAGHTASGTNKTVAASATHDAVDLAAEVSPRLLRRFQPLPQSFVTAATQSNDAEVNLGRQLFFEPRLSQDAQTSCNSCHNLATFGVDNAKTSTGHDGKIGKRNSPTVYNAAGMFVQFWDGRAPNVEEQAKGPILNPIEMAMPDADAVVHELKRISGYAEPFTAAFPDDPDPITFDNVGRAIGAFERGLVTPSRWDKYLEGDRSQLTTAEKIGLKTFLNAGCMVCHTGTLLGGSMFERVGVVEPWPNQSDTGRMEVTKAASDNMVFKVPTLRNIEKTAPYFHDGSAATLEDAVHMMGKHQLGLDLSEQEIVSIVAWLKSLTGEIPASYVAKPDLPK